MTTKALAGVVAALTLITVVIAAGTVLLAGASACAAAVPTASSLTSPAARGSTPQAATGTAAPNGCSGPRLSRAATWLTAWHGGPVPYLSSDDPATWFNGYRRDCSGYVSMALGLPGPGLDTAALAARSTPLSKADLLPGDLLINPAAEGAGHVVIFDHWSDTTMTSYLGYEQSGDGGTHHRVIPYPYFGGYPMGPYRFVFSVTVASDATSTTS